MDYKKHANHIIDAFERGSWQRSRLCVCITFSNTNQPRWCIMSEFTSMCIRLRLSETRGTAYKEKLAGVTPERKCRNHIHFMKIAPAVQTAPKRSPEICYPHFSINGRYFISNTLLPRRLAFWVTDRAFRNPYI